jgi:hypothetical protein
MNNGVETNMGEWKVFLRGQVSFIIYIFLFYIM